MSDFVERIKNVCYAEWLHFGKQTYSITNSLTNQGMRETDAGFWQRIGVYWELGTGSDKDGQDTDWPWSAAFISYVMKMAGADKRFKYSTRHSDYINESIHGNTRFFKGRKLNEYTPKVGDLVCYSKQHGISLDQLPKYYKSHTDIVVNKTPKYIEVIGGNVGNSVSKKYLKIDDKGRLIDTNHKWFVIMENKL